jgi:hypothetical protein
VRAAGLSSTLGTSAPQFGQIRSVRRTIVLHDLHSTPGNSPSSGTPHSGQINASSRTGITQMLQTTVESGMRARLAISSPGNLKRGGGC